MKDNEIRDEKMTERQGKLKRTFKSGDSELDLDQISQCPRLSIHKLVSE
jgi:hypothetical protein